jgi:hypothetical protein
MQLKYCEEVQLRVFFHIKPVNLIRYIYAALTCLQVLEWMKYFSSLIKTFG